MTGTIFNIKRFAVNDGPGIRTTVFLKGCPLRCFWCHNPESWSSVIQAYTRRTWLDNHEFCEQEQVGREVTVEALVAELEKERLVMEESGGGVTFSGGEPLMQPLFLLQSLKACREFGFHTAVDTSGYAETGVFESILPYTDLFLYDLKMMDDDIHTQYTGAGNRQILRNLKWLSGYKKEVIIRIPMVEGLTSTNDNIGRMADFLECLENPVAGIDLLPYHRLGKSKFRMLQAPDLPVTPAMPPDSERIQEILSFFKRKGFSAHIR